MNTCQAILKSGKRKNQKCNRNRCKVHRDVEIVPKPVSEKRREMTIQEISKKYNIPIDELYTDIEPDTYIGILREIIDNNDYVKKIRSTPLTTDSLKSLLPDKNLSQSDSIRLGIGIERVIEDMILYFNHILENIKPKNKKGQKERDHLFKDVTTNTIFYAEIKCNLRLDTEKARATVSKCKSNLEEIKKEYPEYTVRMALVSGKHLYAHEIPNDIIKKFPDIKILGINEYLKLLNISWTFDEWAPVVKYLHDRLC